MSAVVTLEPNQAGTGDPSPENVRPISGYDSVSVTQSKDEAQIKQINLTLPETIYGGTVDAVTGAGTKTWGFVEFDGTEKWKLYSGITAGGQKTFFFDIGVERYEDYITALCDRAKWQFSNWSIYAPWSISGSLFSNSVYIAVPDSIALTIDEWKSYLASQYAAGTPVTVCYKLATPTSFQATGNQPLPAVAGLNTVYTDGDGLDVTGRQDLLYTLQTMQTQTQNLNRFIAEGGTQ